MVAAVALMTAGTAGVRLAAEGAQTGAWPGVAALAGGVIVLAVGVALMTVPARNRGHDREPERR